MLELTQKEIDLVSGGDFSFKDLGGAMLGGALGGAMMGSIGGGLGIGSGAVAGGLIGGAVYAGNNIWEVYC